MNKKLKGMEIILVLASIFIAVANIGLFTSDFMSSSIIKGIIGFIIPSILLFISFQVEKGLKLDKTSKTIQLISMFSYFISLSGVYFDLVTSYGVDEGFIKIGSVFISELLLIPVFAIIVSLIGIYLNKDITYKKLIILTTYFLFYFILNTINKNFTINLFGMKYGNELFEYSILSVIVLIYNCLLKLKYSKTLSIANLFYSLYAIYNAPFNLDTIAPALFISGVSIIAFLIRIRKEESKAYDVVPFIGIMLFLINLLGNYGEKLLLLPLIFIIITDMLIVVFDIVKDKSEGLTFKIFMDILTLIVLLISIINKTDLIMVSVIVIASSLASTYALKSDYHEQYILPFKMVLCIIALLIELKNSIKLDPLLIVLVVNIFATIASYITKNDAFKKLFISIVFISFLYLIEVTTVFEFIISAAIFVFDYAVLIMCEKRSNVFKYIFTAIITGITLINLGMFDYPILYLISSVLFASLYLVSKERGIKVISSLAFLYSITVYISKLPISYKVIDAVNTIITFGVIYYLVCTSTSLNNNIFKIALIIINSLVLLNYDNTVSILVSLAINVILLITYMKNNSAIFKTSIVLTVISGLYTLSLLEEVPTFVYLLILGLTVVVIIYKKIQKFINEPHTEEEKDTKVNFCTECGKKIDSETRFCPECGNKIRK